MHKKNYLFIFTIILMQALFSGCNKNKISFLTVNNEALIPLNKSSEKNKIEAPEKEAYLFYRFTDRQKALIKEMQCYQEGVSFKIKVFSKAVKKENAKFSFGFLNKKDFDSDKKVISPLSPRYQVRGSYSDVKTSVFSLQLCIKKSDEPEGFYFYSASKAELLECSFDVYKVGIEYKNQMLYAFACEGGRVSSDISQIDFSNAFKTLSTNAKIILKLNQKKSLSAKKDDRIVFENKGERFFVRISSCNEFNFHFKSFKNGFGLLKITEGLDFIESIIAISSSEEKAIASDIGMILDWPLDSWRRKDFELFRWSIFPEVLFFDFADYKIQDSFLTRLAYFVEKNGYKGTFVDDDFILNNHGYNAHDYKAYDLARFFSKAKSSGILLNDNELLLRDILLENGIIILLPDGSFEEGRGSIISISRESSPYLRRQLVAHECWHGIYFMNEDFRNYVKNLYEKFNPVALDFLKSYWHTAPGLGYDLNDEYLMKNEFMAYLLQLSPEATGKYFVTRSYWTHMRQFSELKSYVQQTEGMDFQQAAFALSNYVYDKWGLYGGRAFLVYREDIK